MVFSSVLFLFRFLPIFMMLYFLAPGRVKNLVLLIGSLIFYAWGEPVYVVLMLFSTVSDYIHGILIGPRRGTKAGKALLVSSVVINLLMLGFFKYADFIIGTLIDITFWVCEFSISISAFILFITSFQNLSVKSIN